MVGSERGKEAAGMMALHEALRNVCMNSDWTYSVFWTIRPRPRSRGGNGCKVGDDNGSLMLMWEDGFCRPGLATECLEDVHGDDPVRKAFSKMSIQLYNYGEGLMGKVASDKCHKWVFKEPSECEPNISNCWQSSFDAIPPEWTEQFASGIQTIAVIQAGYGLLQLGSSKIIAEDLHFVLRMRHTFESLGYQSGFYLSQLFSAVRNGSASSSPNLTKTMTRPPPVFKWVQRPFHSAPPAPNFSNAVRPSFPTTDETHLFLPHAHESQIEIVGDHDVDIKWPNGLSFFNALTGRTEDNGKLLSVSDSSICGWRELGVSEQRTNPTQRFSVGKRLNLSSNSITMVGAAAMDDQKMIVGRDSSADAAANASVSEYLSLEWHGSNTGDRLKKMENRFKRSFTMPARMDSSSAGNSYHRPVSDFPGLADTGMYSDVMETLLD